MKIGELSKTSGTSIETIRYYESEGLLPAPGRTDSNYRIYGPEHADRLSFIRHCRSLDMALGEIRTLLESKDAPLENCASVNQLLDDHIGHVATRIRELKALSRSQRAPDLDRASHGAGASSTPRGVAARNPALRQIEFKRFDVKRMT